MIPSLDERRLRIDLAACYRLVALYGGTTWSSRTSRRELPGERGF